MTTWPSLTLRIVYQGATGKLSGSSGPKELGPENWKFSFFTKYAQVLYRVVEKCAFLAGGDISMIEFHSTSSFVVWLIQFSGSVWPLYGWVLYFTFDWWFVTYGLFETLTMPPLIWPYIPYFDLQTLLDLLWRSLSFDLRMEEILSCMIVTQVASVVAATIWNKFLRCLFKCMGISHESAEESAESNFHEDSLLHWICSSRPTSMMIADTLEQFRGVVPTVPKEAMVQPSSGIVPVC
jgi:hypothetical protein